MAGTFATELAERGVVRVGGPDAAHFLNNLVTSEVEHLADGEAAYAALLTPQGKMLFDFLALREADGYRLDTAAENAAALAQRLGFYKLRARVTVADLSADEAVIAFWGGEPPATLPGVAYTDPRLPALGKRVFVARGSVAGVLALPGLTRTDSGAFHAHRVALGVPEGGRDFAFGDAFPHDADMDALAGIDFAKGCYVGQEVVSRMQHRGTARRRIVMASADGALPPAGTALTAGDRPVGTLGTVSGTAGLALVRLDRAKAAIDAGQPIVADGTTVTLSIPPWASFGWPATAAAEDV
ncbi:folate-binding protein [Pseudoxanthobacter sp. M-2]|uniref:CAF17-like 4Fe-4S cluster assembly/insertion protein YgfZ n=1 Tax=Pseudoxanthobacter sp. M-2 TaxID=3078754 RepID=UPI0038FC2278